MVTVTEQKTDSAVKTVIVTYLPLMYVEKRDFHLKKILTIWFDRDKLLNTKEIEEEKEKTLKRELEKRKEN